MVARFGNFLKKLFLQGTTDAMAEANRPILRGYLALAGIYYSVMVPVLFFVLSGLHQLIMVSVSLAAAIVAAVGWWLSRKQLSSTRLEQIGAVANLFVYANVMAALHTSMDPSNLIYFPMLAFGFAFTSVSIRMAIVSISIVLGTLYYELTAHFADQGLAYGYIGFATAFCGFAMVVFLQRAILTATGAQAAAERKLDDAEAKLIEADRLNVDMRRRAMSDSLTGLPNRRAFFGFLRENREQGLDNSEKWLIALDLDGFKMVNDVYGHIVGDELLVTVTKRMQDYCGADAKVSRIGGDEFNVILDGIAGEEACAQWCNALLEKIAEPYDVEGRLIQLSASIGCTRLINCEDSKVLIRNADYALLHAKKHGKNRTIVFTLEHEKNAKERFEIEDALRLAEFSSEIQVLFQPQVDLDQNQVVRAEALARWDCPELGRIEPDRFISIAEESGLISKITLAVLAKSIAALKQWENPVPLAINLSGHDLLSNQVMDEIIAMLTASDLDPKLLEFEVTETAMMADTEKACDNLNRLSKLGYSVALDDFGTGYSNFNYLRELPIDKLKVDRSFVKDIGNPMTEKILHSLAVTASALGVDCLLEGVEDEIQLVMAKRVGASSVQGYLFGKPMENAELVDLIAEQGDTGAKVAVK
ncbi:MAG: EAL domain-containing protein [Erythrobacter sp.]